MCSGAVLVVRCGEDCSQISMCLASLASEQVQSVSEWVSASGPTTLLTRGGRGALGSRAVLAIDLRMYDEDLPWVSCPLSCPPCALCTACHVLLFLFSFLF